MSNANKKPQKINVRRCFDEAVDIYKSNAITLIAANFIFIALSIISLTILTGPLWGGYCLMLLKGFRGKNNKICLGDIFSQMYRFWPLFSLMLIQLVLLILSGILLIIPMLILNCFFLYTEIIMIEKNIGVFESIKSSFKFVLKGGFGSHFLISIFVLILALIPDFIPYVGWILDFFTAPIAALIIVSAYLQQMEVEMV
jgi:hypothetical protein